MLHYLGYLITIITTVSAVILPIAATSAVSVSESFISVTPHQQFSSSIGVLGCMIDTNRVAYWPSSPDCGATMCVRVSYNSRSVNLLHIDRSGGAYDISYDAWNYLYTGKSATQDPQYGGGIAATYTILPISECTNLITSPDKKLPLTAANSMDYVANCLVQNTSWVASNYGLWNIATSACTYGIDEECILNLTVSNQPTCPHQLGLQVPLTTLPVFDIEYGTGKKILAV
ncbi:hypothetical protein sscle_11g081570 [Sclerotinia sclerotiorum 1980 UF-70]|uniref:Cerato-platanin n=1 Tax=Sclerotinia sclerotiorum (strain ATCC 18683 / 1980 / Ss-1) TaxID=665079 RepID=A0A1D9QEM8_SCLS1|nr:hypothetical protein sscle_11g081570 [Sclerotinia sclerotiorum 1980 UF-70]